MFIINSLVGPWDIKVLKAYRQQAVLKLKTRERDYLPWNSEEQFAKTVHTDANFKGLVMICEAYRDKKSQTTTSKCRIMVK